ncbi:MAG: MgtC/SapB family protein [Polyangiaceae bacterium]|nr:MgtC/SapB family protein [Polyangiaceae bacterium]
MALSHLEMLGRIGTGALLGAVIGYERDRHKRPVGLRTHTLVAIASATFMVVSSQFAYFQSYVEGGPVEVDGSRIAASVVSAVGFLAGGTILRSGATVQGLTTAAGLWLVTAIGLCAGGGMMTEAIGVTALGVLVLTVLRRFEDKEDDVVIRNVAVVLEEGSSPSLVLQPLEALGVSVRNVQYDRRLDDKRRTELAFVARTPRAIEASMLVTEIEKLEGVRRIRVSEVGS